MRSSQSTGARLRGPVGDEPPPFLIVRLWGSVVGNVYYRVDGKLNFLCVGFGKVKSDTLSDQHITFTRFRYETLPIQDRNLLPPALNQTCTFQLSGSIRDGWPLNTQHFGKQVLRDRQHVPVSAVTHHEEPTRQSLLEAVGTVACYRHHDLLKKGLDVSVHKTSEGRHRFHGPCKRGARHLCCAPRDLDKKPDGGTLGTEDGLHTRTTLPSDRCHLNDAAVLINRYDGDDTAIREEYVVERTIGVHEDLLALAANVFKLRHKPLEIAGGQGEQKPIAGPI
jgi:hypothetical protein